MDASWSELAKAVDNDSDAVFTALKAEDPFVTVAIEVAGNCESVFGLLSPADGIAAMDCGDCDCCPAIDSVEETAANGVFPIEGVACPADAVPLVEFPPPICRCRLIASEQRIEPSLMGFDPRLADELSEKVGPRATLPWASLKAWQATSA